MKTKEDWNERFIRQEIPDMREFIAAIQHDARQQGYTEAAELLTCQHDHDAAAILADAQRSILTARNSLPKP